MWRPEVIQHQMLFTDNTMLKLFLSASATSALVVQLLHLLNPQLQARVSAEYTQSPRGLAALLVGGLIVGE